MNEQERFEMSQLPEDVQQAFMQWCVEQWGQEEPECFG